MAIPPELAAEAKRMLKERILGHRIDVPRSGEPGERQKIALPLREIAIGLARKYRIKIEEYDLKLLEENVVNELTGFGLIDRYIRDPEITDIFVNGPDQIFIEKNGKLVRSELKFEDSEEIMALIDRMITESGKRIDHLSPFVDFKIKGGLRVTAVIPPVATPYPIFTIRKMSRGQFTFDDLKRLGTINDKVLKFLESCVRARINILVAGGTGTGKTTLTNLLIRQFVPEEERIVVIEDVEEMFVRGTNHSIKILTRPSNMEGKGEIDLRELVKLSLHLRPDRIVIGEIRGEEAFHFLNAINTGHEGSMCTIHASNPEDALHRLEILALMDRPNIQPSVIRRFLELGIDMVVQMSRLPNGQRIISSVACFEYRDGWIIKEIFNLQKKNANGRDYWEIKATGTPPSFMNRLLAKTDIKEDFFR